MEKETETKRYRHDFTNHLICLGEIAKEGNTNGVTSYISNLQETAIEIQSKTFFTGCNILDIFINYYAHLLDIDTVVTVKGKCSRDLAINDVDMCIIFANLLQNAVENLNRQDHEEKYMRVDVKEGDVYLKVLIINSLGSETSKIEKFSTTKKEKENHGYGLANITEAVKRNEGHFSIEICNNECIASVTLKNKTN